MRYTMSIDSATLMDALYHALFDVYDPLINLHEVSAHSGPHLLN